MNTYDNAHLFFTTNKLILFCREGGKTFKLCIYYKNCRKGGKTLSLALLKKRLYDFPANNNHFL